MLKYQLAWSLLCEPAVFDEWSWIAAVPTLLRLDADAICQCRPEYAFYQGRYCEAQKLVKSMIVGSRQG